MRLATVIIAAAGLLAGGCAPTLTISHALPAAVPLPEGGAVRVGRITVQPADRQPLADAAAKMLEERLSGLPPRGQGPGLSIDGTIRVQVDDESGTRQVRLWDAGAGAWKSATVPSLVRNIGMEADFLVQRGGERLFAVPVRQKYSSAKDPRVLGDLGLGRTDDPAAVLPVDSLEQELLAACVDSFVGMLRPYSVEVQVPLRATLDGDGAAGLDAAAKGLLNVAEERLRAAVEKNPRDAGLKFNLAAVLEAAGRLQEAARYYLSAAELAGNRDPEAAKGADRTKKIHQRTARVRSSDDRIVERKNQ